MIENKDRALKVAELLLKVKAVKLQPNEPFTWASGWKSPIYCDNRVTLSHPSVRTFIRQAFCEMILEMFGNQVKPSDIAKTLGVDKSYVNRIIKSRTEQ
jgi:orotate phosphoribosyltransferase